MISIISPHWTVRVDVFFGELRENSFSGRKSAEHGSRQSDVFPVSAIP